MDACICKQTVIPAGDGIARVRRESKGRGGKTVTTITGVPLAEDALKELATTLKRIAKNGAAEFYRGETARMLVSDMAALGGLITLDDLAKVGSIIDGATAAGANHVQGIQFTLRDQQRVRSQALREAATKARAEADALASALGLKVVRILTVEETSPVVVPVRDGMFAARAEAARAPTPIEAGTIDVTANVTLAVEVSAAAR